MHKTSFFVLLALLLVAIGVWAVWSRFTAAPTSTPATTSYSSPQAGILFEYKNTYIVEMRKDSFEGKEVTVLTLTDPIINMPDMSEGPPGISIIIVSDPEQAPLAAWVREKSISNFYLSANTTLSSTSVAGEEGVAYTYSGLYENDAIAVTHTNKKYLFFGSWGTAGDPIRSDFQNLIKTVQFI